MGQVEKRTIELSRRLPPPVIPAPFELEGVPAHLSTWYYLPVVLRQWWKIAIFVATAVFLTYIASSRITPIYEATAKVDVDRRTPLGIIGQEAAQTPGTDDADQFMATQIELIESDAVLRPVVEKYNLLQREKQLDRLTPDQVKLATEAPLLLKHLSVTRPVNTYVLQISYRSPDRQIAADVANAIAQSYLEQTFDIRARTSTALSAFMAKQLDELRAKMERSGMALAKFEQELNVINPEEKTNILSARLLQLNTEYTNAQADRVRKEASYNAVKSGATAATEVSTQGEALTKLAERVDLAKQHLAEIASVYGPNHAEYRKAANTVAEVQRQFAEAQRTVAQRIETDYREAVNRESMLQKAVAETKAEYDQLNAHSFEYQQLKRDAEGDKALYSDLERRIREAGINAGFQNSAIRIADLARPPRLPVFPNVKLNLVLAFIASLVLGICGAVARDALDKTIRDPEQAARVLKTTVIGVLPTVKDKRLMGPMPSELSARGKQSAAVGLVRHSERKIEVKPETAKPLKTNENVLSYEEAIRTLRHSILLPDFDRSVKSLLLTSAAPGDGKSTAGIHLAVAHADQGKRTLIIDADLRRPNIHKKLGVDGTAGLSNVLLGQTTWRRTVVTTRFWPNLDVIPAGFAPRRASDLVGSMMIDVIEEASAEYDLVIVDAPPLLGFAEALQVAAAVDGVVVIARAGQTSRKAISIVFATLRRLRANVLGLVLNEVDKTTGDGYNYYDEYRKYYAEAPAQTT